MGALWDDVDIDAPNIPPPNTQPKDLWDDVDVQPLKPRPTVNKPQSHNPWDDTEVTLPSIKQKNEFTNEVPEKKAPLIMVEAQLEDSDFSDEDVQFDITDGKQP